MEQYNITGMSCAACSARVEKAVAKLPEVSSCSVSLLTNSMSVEGMAPSAEIIAAVEGVGYGAVLKSSKNEHAQDYGAALKDTETPKMKKRLIASLCILVPLMYFSMGHMMWGFPLPEFFEGNHIAMGLVQLLLTAAVMVINQKFFINGFKGLWHRAPNMDTLVALGSVASFVYSTAALFAMTGAQLKGDSAAVMGYMNEFYFESAAMILTLITVGKMLEARSKGKTTDAIKSLMSLAPKTAVVIRGGEQVKIPAEQVVKGDLFAVRPGESFPVDGIVREGSGAVDESALTGESVPVDKAEGDAVSAATINRSGYFVCEASRVGEDTTLSQIIKTVSEAAATKAPIAKAADKVSAVFVPAVIGIAAVTFVIWLIAGESLGYALARAISVLVISCPCALGLATPVAIMVGSGMGAKYGIMFKTAVSLEETGKIKTAVLDKTGTITKGEPKVTDIFAEEGFSESELLSTAYALEQKSEHPLAKAVIAKAEEMSTEKLSAEDFKAAPGNGLTGTVCGKPAAGGNLRFIEQNSSVNEKMKAAAERFSAEGKTPLFFSKNGMLMGIIAVADVIKEDSAKAVRELKNMGIRVVMLTGDNEKTAAAIGKQAGVDEVIAGVLPEGKAEAVKKLAVGGRVAMVGEGINDAPALTAAEIGIAVGAGTDIAIDAADVVLMKSRLTDVPAAVRLSRATLRIIRENLFWAFIYNVIGIPLAAGLWIPIFGWTLDPMFAAAAMSLSSFCVVINALRLNLFKMYMPESAAAEVAPEKKKGVLAELKIEGMMCPHCEASVKSALLSLEGAVSAEADHSAGKALVELAKPLPDEALISAVEKAGYKVVKINRK